MAILMVAMIGGLISGIVCSVAVIAVTDSLVDVIADQTTAMIQTMEVNCTQDIVTGESFRCQLSFKKAGQEKEFNIDPVPRG